MEFHLGNMFHWWKPRADINNRVYEVEEKFHINSAGQKTLHRMVRTNRGCRFQIYSAACSEGNGLIWFLKSVQWSPSVIGRRFTVQKLITGNTAENFEITRYHLSCFTYTIMTLIWWNKFSTHVLEPVKNIVEMNSDVRNFSYAPCSELLKAWQAFKHY